LLVMPRKLGVVILTVVWSGALAGIVLKQAWIKAPRWISVPPYVALGWVAIFVLPDMLRHAGVAALVLLLCGGVVYSIGAAVYGIRRPNPWPRTFGYHEVFHLCTIVAALCHYIAIWFAVYSGR
jgi:hemolysin III